MDFIVLAIALGLIQQSFINIREGTEKHLGEKEAISAYIENQCV